MDGSNDKKYYIHINKKVKIEVSKQQYIQHHKEREHHKYLKKEERKVAIMSYEGLGENLSAEGIISDRNVDVEENAIKTLSEEELLLIERLIYQEKNERKIASEIEKWEHLKYLKYSVAGLSDGEKNRRPYGYTGLERTYGLMGGVRAS